MLAAAVEKDLKHFAGARQHGPVSVELLGVHHDDHIAEGARQTHLIGLLQQAGGVVGVLELDQTHFSYVHYGAVAVHEPDSWGSPFPFSFVFGYLCKKGNDEVYPSRTEGEKSQ